LKTVVVTGASSGIGYATCEHLIRNRYFVFGTVRSPRDGERLRNTFGEMFIPLELDVTNPEQIVVAVARVREHLRGNKLSALVNNAGVAIVGPLEHLTAEQLRMQIEVNVVGVFAVTQAFLPLLGTETQLKGESGKIINISSVAGKKGTPFSGAYVASKHALEGMSESWRQELMIHGIDVVIVGPGVVDTPIWEKHVAQNIERFNETIYWPSMQELLTISRSYVKRGYKPAKVAKVIVQAIEHRRARVRYAVVPNRWLNGHFVRLIPKRWMDWLIAQRLKLLRK
jgi:NAD(P)-dependent dehydrogenase (short-subunit alcohol dehydrogenase family)